LIDLLGALLTATHRGVAAGPLRISSPNQRLFSQLKKKGLAPPRGNPTRLRCQHADARADIDTGPISSGELQILIWFAAGND
jgi:hypothetical protein